MKSPCALCVDMSLLYVSAPPPQFMKFGNCLFYVSSGRTTEKTQPQTVERVVFYVIRVISKESRPLVLPRTPFL